MTPTGVRARAKAYGPESQLRDDWMYQLIAYFWRF